MPDPLDTLRNDIARLLSESWPYQTDALMEFFAAASGEQRRALLGILGYSVEERDACSRMNNAPICPGENRCDCENPDPRPVLVLRDQRETTDGE